MPSYVLFLEDGTPIRSEARIRPHTPEWTNPKGTSPSQAGLPEVDDEVLIAFEIGDSAPGRSQGGWQKLEGLEVTWNVPAATRGAAGRGSFGARLEFTRLDGAGREFADLSFDLHDVRFVSSGIGFADDGRRKVRRVVIACSRRMTLAGTGKSAPDMSPQLRARIGRERLDTTVARAFRR